MDYNFVCFIIGDLYIKSQEQIKIVREECQGLVATLQEQLVEKDNLIQNLESELKRISSGNSK